MTDNIRSKVRKLLALAGDAGATDNEREVAMRKAQQMIEEYNIDLSEDETRSRTIHIGRTFIIKAPYHHLVANAVAALYHGYAMLDKDTKELEFFGMVHQVEAIEETFVMVIDQIEDLYRVALKAFDGRLTKSQRAELRASFKDAAAARVFAQVRKILNSHKPDSRALVVLSELDQLVKRFGSDARAGLPALREGFGTGVGWNAGGLVRLQGEVES
jgi:hypothetical protein